MRALGKFIGGCIFRGAILGAIGWGFYAFIFFGIFGIVNGATSIPVDVHAIVWGVIWVAFLAKLSAIGIGLVCMLIGGIIIAVSGEERPKVFGKW